MTPFLLQVARHYHPAPEINRMCFIFPNKRSIAFFRKYLGDLCAAEGKAMIAPKCLAINEFFTSMTPLVPADRLSAATILYECYAALNPKAEPLDEFVFWGNVLLSDFAEVDKYLVNPSHIFRNVADFRQMQDDMDYLEPAQKEAMEHFLRQFVRDGDYKRRFLRIWDILLPLYDAFNARMAEKGMATEGQIYRRLAERLDSESVADLLVEAFPGTEKFVFAGLNALNECEKKVLRKMRDAHLAEFCWDFSSTEIKDPANRSSFFLSRNIADFPQAFIPDPEGLPRPVVNVVSVPSSAGQAKLLPRILSSLTADTKSVGINTAIVLPDEGLLLNVLNSIPEEIRDVNVTMGYPMHGSEFSSLLEDIAAMQTGAREKGGYVQFYHRHVWGIFSNSLLRSVISEKAEAIIRQVRLEAKYYIDSRTFSEDPLLGMIFRPASDIPSYLKELICALAPLLRLQDGREMELEFAMFVYKAATRLEGLELDVQPRTWWKLFAQLTSRTAVPFKGEPLKGLQIMGPLETRALDFDNVVVLSCNEGMFPRRSVAPSFIPAELKKGFGLPTYEYQDAVWAYYFYRMIQRASNVWLLSDSRTEMSRSGEPSRYILQLQMLYGFDVRRWSVDAPLHEGREEGPVPKTDGDVAVMHGEAFHLSASALQNYLNCPASFYYSKILGLKPSDEVSEALDASMLGTVFHETMHRLYEGRTVIEEDFLKAASRDTGRILAIIQENIKKQLRSDEVEGRNLIFEDIVLKYVLQVLKTDLALLKKHHAKEFRVLGLELSRRKTIGGFRFVGIIDRLDSFSPGTVRVVDYKTGKVGEMDIHIDDGNASQVVDAIFGDDNSKRPKIALQLYLYDELLENDPRKGEAETENCIYQTGNLFVQLPESIPASGEFRRLMRERIEGLLKQMEDTSVPWSRTSDPKTCEICDFKTICGR